MNLPPITIYDRHTDTSVAIKPDLQLVSFHFHLNVEDAKEWFDIKMKAEEAVRQLCYDLEAKSKEQ